MSLMRSIPFRVFASLFVLFTLIISPRAQGAFKCEPIPPEYRDTIGKELGQKSCEYQNDLKSDKLPAGARNARLGRLAFDEVHPVLFAAYASAEGKPLDAIVFDLNGDADFTNDPTFTGFTEPTSDSLDLVLGNNVTRKGIEIQLPNGPLCQMTVTLTPDSILVKSNLWLRGKLLLDGQEREAALFCSDALGFDSEENEIKLVLDVNGNGKFDGEQWNIFERMGPEEFHFESEITIQGALYEARFDKARMELVLTRYTGPQGKLDLKPEFASKVKSWGLRGHYGPPEIKGLTTAFSINSQHGPIILKAGDIRIQFAQMCLLMESGKRNLVLFSMESPLRIKDGETTLLQVDKFKRFDIALEQKGNQLMVRGLHEGENGVKQTLIIPLPERSEKPVAFANYPEPINGQVVIRDAQGRQIGTGTLECWKSETCEYAWSLPPTVKKGDRIKVSLTWETDLFGKLEAEKEIVLEDVTPTPKESPGNMPSAQQDVTLPAK
jgi:hypothetical protein